MSPALRAAAAGCVAVVLAAGAAAEEGPRLSLERIMGSPALAGRVPRGLALSPDGTLATLLEPRPDDRDRYDLWAIDTSSGERRMLLDSTAFGGGEISEEEKMRRERARVGGSRGVVSYAWAPDSRSVLVPLDGDLYVAATGGAAAEVRRLTDTPATELDAKISPRGGFVSFVRDGNLHLHHGLNLAWKQNVCRRGSGHLIDDDPIVSHDLFKGGAKRDWDSLA